MRLELRPVRAADAPFLARVHDEARTDLLGVGLAGEPLRRLLAMQHEAEERSWAASFAGLERYVVVVDRQDVGRAYVVEDADGIRIVDLSILAEHRGRGIGAAVLGHVVDRAPERPVHLTVRRGNPARRLYARLGFVPVDGTATHVAMVRDP